MSDSAANDPGAAEFHPQRIGRYEVLGLLGEGGMGRVYRCRESDPPREVALKLVRGLERQALARFRREAELLAALEHPGIARLYASGEADFAGMRLPWLALEYVRGSDLLSHAETHALDLRARLRLLIEVCRAAHYAHGRGVIHRDLKPGNILVDEQGHARILDFGIARLGADADGMTQAGQVLGTVPYMSPEQLAGRSREVDARSDVYSLGVIAYELVARRLPYPQLSTSTVLEALQIVARASPPDLATLAPKARGDLAVVVMKAIAAEPQRRYASAAEFAADLERVLDQRPVEARAPTLGYLLSRLLRRHRALSAALAATFLVLLAATVVSLRFAWAEAAARREAVARAAELQAVNGFLQDMLAAANPAQAQGREVTVKDLLGPAEAELERSHSPPLVRAALYSTLADTRIALGDPNHGLALLDRARALLDDAAESAPLRGQLARQRLFALTELGRLDEAMAESEAALALTAGLDEEQRLGTRLTVARLHQERGDFAYAEATYRDLRQSLSARSVPLSEPLQRTLDTAESNLGLLLRDSGRLDEALALARQVHAQREARLGARHPLTLASQQKLGLALAAKGDADAAIDTLSAALAAQREVLGDRHADTLWTLQSLAEARLGKGDLDGAEPLVRESLAGWEAGFGDAHPQTLAALNALAYLQEERQDIDGAEATYRRVLAIEGRDGKPSAGSLAPRNNLAMLLLKHGRAAQALPEFESLLADTRAIVGEQHPMYAIFSSNLGLCLVDLGRRERAIEVLSLARDKLKATFDAQHPRVLAVEERLARAQALAVPR